MSTSSHMTGRRALKSFRLADVPVTIRNRAVDNLLRKEEDFSMRIAIGMAAMRPSNKVYHVSQDAWERVVHPKNRRTP